MRVVLVIAALLMATPSMAAVVGNVTGSVQVNQGNGFNTIPASTEVRPGHVVRTGANSSATVYYENGCALKIDANKTVTVQENPSCDAAALNTGNVVAGVAIVGGAIGVGVMLAASP